MPEKLSLTPANTLEVVGDDQGAAGMATSE